ncbi:PKD domain-containing protein [Pseudactinotalea sp. Z1739]|uniref:PKD domain-containing protein n=1 Tax=Pseudactinotalea sp. Z1739 TaxID=3413028 RepID=UPI003C7CE00C
MSRKTASPRRRLAAALVLALGLGTGLLALTGSERAEAAVSPLLPRPGEVVTADALPTAQINGVAWDQEVVGNTVFVGGSFTHARPAGASAGTNQSPRPNLMSYTLSTGVMTSWNPTVNGQVRVVKASPDGSRIYIGGDFTQVNGQPRGRIAAFDAATGALISNFAPNITSTVRGIAVSGNTVYAGGSFSSVGGQARQNLAAFNAGNGALLGWQPRANRPVHALDVTEDGGYVIAGGHFETINEASARGLAKIDAADGTVVPWPVVISNAGPDSAIDSVKIANGTVYGSGWHFGPGGNQEGPWRLDVETGDLVWVADCHGDTYDVYPGTHALYAAGHAHYCGNTSLGFPQYNPWRFQHNMAWTHEATGTNIREVHGYANWDGQPSPSILHWLPTTSMGSYTGMSQASWTVEGNDTYVVLGGEFPRVNGSLQQGLVRFATQPIAPGNRGPAVHGNQLVPDLMPVAPGAVKVSWTAGWDPDDQELRYEVRRTPGGVVASFDAASNWWHTPGLAHVDTGLNPGQTYTYQITIDDSTGNRVWGSSRQVTVPTSYERHDYGQAVLADDPKIYWPLNDAPGSSTIADHAGGYHGVPGSAVTFNVPNGPIAENPAVSVNGTNNGRIYAFGTDAAPTEFSTEVWFRTGASSGRLLGFGDLQVGNSAHRDRQIYLANSGRVHFGLRSDGAKVLSSQSQHNNNQWTQAVATLSGSTARLYVNGTLVAQRHDITNPEEYIGHWRLGGDSQSGWPSAGTANFNGSIAHMSVYEHALTPEQVNDHYVASGRASALPTPPEDPYGQAVFAQEPDLYWRLGESSGSTANDSGWMNNSGTYYGGHTKGETGAVLGTTDTAVAFNGSTGYVASVNTFNNPQVFTTEAWFRTTSTAGGKIIGFGNQRTSLSNNYDRHTYMLNTGQLTFGVYPGAEVRVTSPDSYNDGEWHHVVSTLSDAGMRLYVDGVLVDSDPNTAAESFTGHWRAGGDRVWSGASSNYLNGTIDEVAVYARALEAEDVLDHYTLGSGNVPNVPPVAEFDHVVEGLQVAFDASGSSDSDGAIVSYEWDFGDGDTGSGVSPSHTYAESGTYQVTLTVTDDDGASAELTREVSVVEPPVNVPPVAEFEVSVTDLMVSVDASESSDPDGEIVAYDWDFGDGSSGEGLIANHTYTEAGEYTVTLTVTDDDGEADSASREVTVIEPPANAAPTAAFMAVTNDLTVSVDGSDSTDSDGTIESWEWDFGDGGTGAGVSAQHTYAEPGTFEVTLTVTDDDGAQGTYSESVTVTAPPVNQAPEASFTSSVSGLTVTLDGSGSSDPDGAIESYEWVLGDGSTATGQVVVHTYAEAGSYDVTLTVADGEGAEGSDTQAVVVQAPPTENEPPVAAFTATVNGLGVSLDGSDSFDPDGSITSYAWEFGDGNSGSGSTTSHTYAAAGTYTVRLTVVDDDGAEHSVIEEVDVTGSPAPVTHATDTFDRSVTNGWGAADLGGNWSSTNTASLFSVGSGAGQIRVPGAGSGPAIWLNAVSAQDVDATVDVAMDQAATGGGAYNYLAVRRTGNNDYRLIARSMPTGTQVLLTATVNGADQFLDNVTIPLDYEPGQALRLRLIAEGTTPTELHGKVWRVGDPEPANWQVNASDSVPELQGAGGIGLRTYLSGSTTNAPVVSSFDNLHVGAVGGQPVNQAPVAAFTSLIEESTVAFDASGSTDPDGTVEEFSWDFGDGNTGEGEQVSHTYAEPGTYQVTLTVTDDEGATHAVTHEVDIADTEDPPDNEAPVAEFDHVVEGLQVGFDASGSTDPDGTVEEFSWDFGDGNTGEGEQVSHTYAEPGTYQVTLTVTDDEGATHSVSYEVSVESPPAGEVLLAADAFDRTVAGAWGQADVGGNWQPTGAASNFRVEDGHGVIRMASAGTGPRIQLGDLGALDSDTALTLSLDKPPSGGDTYISVDSRRVGNESYRMKIRFQPNQTMLLLTRTVNGTETNLSHVVVPGATYQAGDVFNVRFQAEGEDATTLRARIWRTTDEEPTDWQVTTTDSTPELQRPGGLALVTYLSGSVDNAPVEARFTDLRTTTIPE